MTIWSQFEKNGLFIYFWNNKKIVVIIMIVNYPEMELFEMDVFNINQIILYNIMVWQFGHSLKK